MCSSPYRRVTHNLFVNSAVWMNYEGLIGDPREPNSNSLLVCVEGLEEGPLHCSALLTGCCSNGRWEINGDLMTVGRAQRNNRVLLHRWPSTLVSEDNYLHGCTHTHIHIQELIFERYPRHAGTFVRTGWNKATSIDLSVKEVSSAISALLSHHEQNKPS